MSKLGKIIINFSISKGAIMQKKFVIFLLLLTLLSSTVFFKSVSANLPNKNFDINFLDQTLRPDTDEDLISSLSYDPPDDIMFTTQTISGTPNINSLSADGRYVAFTSFITHDNGSLHDNVFVYDQQLEEITLVSVNSNGERGNYISYVPRISADGRYVAFTSSATNLVNDDNNNSPDAFIHDRQTGETSLVSISSGGSQGNNESLVWSISADGRYVAFQSDATNLVPNDTNNARDVFVHDRQTGETTRVSMTYDGSQANNGSYAPTISGDGRYVAFHSDATNLVPNDTKNARDVFVYDRYTYEISIVSIDSSGDQKYQDSETPSISADGRFVAFSTIDSFVPEDTNGWGDIYVHDRDTGVTTRVSVSSDGEQGTESFYTRNPSISADGRYVTFWAHYSDLVPNDTNEAFDIFLHDRQTGETTLISKASDGTQGNDHSLYPSISSDGSQIVFISEANNLVLEPTNAGYDGRYYVYVHDHLTGMTKRISKGMPENPPDSISGTISMSDGSGLGGVTLATHTGQVAVTNSAGDYTLSGLSAGTYILTPSKSGYKFNPSSLTIEITSSNVSGQDFSASPASGFSIEQIEITQATQSPNNSVPLVAGKATMVRAYVDCGAGCVRMDGVSGVLRAYRDGVLIGEINPPDNIAISAYHNDHWSDQRGSLHRTLNFTLPTAWTQPGTLTLAVESMGSTLWTTNTFTSVPELSIAYIPIRDDGMEPLPTTMRNAIVMARKLYPTHKISYDLMPGMKWSIPEQCKELEGNQKMFCEGEDLIKHLNNYYSQSNLSYSYDFAFGWLPENMPVSFTGVADSPWGGIGKVASGKAISPISGLILSHEVGHLLDQRHTNTDTEQCGPVDLNSPWHDYYTDSFIDNWGLDVTGSKTLKDVKTHVDYMSYCWLAKYGNKPAWTSSFIYNQIFDYIRFGLPLRSSSSSIRSSAQTYFNLSGMLFVDDAGQIYPPGLVTTSSPYSNPPFGSNYCLEGRNAVEETVIEQCFDLDFIDYETSGPSEVDFFNLLLPYYENINRFVLLKGDLVLDEILFSPNPPQVVVSFPNGGESWIADGEYTITWSASDADGDDLTYNVLYSTDGVYWTQLGVNLTESQLTVLAADLPGTTTARVRVEVSDGAHISTDESDELFEIAAKSPQVEIIQPETDTTALEGIPISLTGSAWDLEDGPLGAEALTWTSSIDGELGKGETLEVVLTPGDHIITLTAEDSSSNTTSDSKLVSTLVCHALLRGHSGNGGDPLSSPEFSLGCPEGFYLAGEIIELTATPSPGWFTAGWLQTNDDSSIESTNTLTMPAEDHAVACYL